MSGKNWILVFIISAFVSVIFGGVHLFLKIKLGNNYSPLLLNSSVPSFTADETIAYAPKVRDILDGNLILTDIYLKEHKKLPSPLIGENLPAMIMALFAKISGGIPNAFILADYLFPTLIFLMLTKLIYQINRNLFFSSFVSLFVLSFSRIMELIPYFPSLFMTLINNFLKGTYSEFYKNFHPQISFVFFVLFIFSCLLVWQKNRRLLWLINGFFAGLLLYTDVFFASYAFTLLLTFLCYAIIKKKYLLTMKVFGGLLLTLFMSLPYIFNFFAFRKLPQAEQYFLNFQYSLILPIKEIIFCLTLFFLSLFLKPKKIALFFRIFFVTGLTLLTASYFMKININDSPGHWMTRVIYPFSLVALFLIFQQWFKKSTVFWFIGSFLVLFYLAFSHYRYFAKQPNIFFLSNEEKEVFSWLNQKTEPESVVLTASLRHNLLLPALTHNNVFLPYSQYSLASEKEAFDRFFILYKMLQISPERIEEMFSQTPSNQALAKIKRYSYDDCAGSYFYYLRFKKQHDYNCTVPSEKLKKIVEDYKYFKLEPERYLLKYQADYLLIGPYEKKWAKIPNSNSISLKLIAQNQSYQLYKINDE